MMDSFIKAKLFYWYLVYTHTGYGVGDRRVSDTWGREFERDKRESMKNKKMTRSIHLVQSPYTNAKHLAMLRRIG